VLPVLAVPLLAALAVQAGCDPKGTALAEPGSDGRVPADATVGAATEDGSVEDAFVPQDGWSTGPDGAAPVACDGASGSQCLPPPPTCSGASTGLLYGQSQCAAGLCRWMSTPFDCRTVSPGALCIGGWNGDASLPPDAAAGARDGPCWILAPQGPAAPVVACDVDAGDGGPLCPPPPSQCVDVDGGNTVWLAYFDEGECVSGQCVWQTKYHFCGGNWMDGCVSGACVRSITAPVPVPVPPGP
jgi:hypothetical protein